MKGEVLYFSCPCPGQQQRGERPWRVLLRMAKPKPGRKQWPDEPRGYLEWSRGTEAYITTGPLAELYTRAEQLGEEK